MSAFPSSADLSTVAVAAGWVIRVDSVMPVEQAASQLASSCRGDGYIDDLS